MKKFLAIFAALVLSAAALTGCGSSKPASTATEQPAAKEETKTEAKADAKADAKAPELTASVLVIDGKEYTFPIEIADLLADGWTIAEDKLATEYAAGELKAETGSIAIKKSDSDKFFIRGVYNPDTSAAQPLSKCRLMGVQFTFSVAPDTTVVFPGGATEKSTYDEIIKLYGDPDTTKDFAGARKTETMLAYDQYKTNGNNFNFNFEEDGKPSSFIFMAAE